MSLVMPVAPPRPKGPPLNALRAFEAAARLGGFRAAADELCVTPGAVAQHIRALEDYLGAPLFERHARGVRLTALGARILPEFSAAFDAMGAAVQTMRSEAASGEVHIAALPAVAQLWLAPRLPALRQAHPGCKISVTVLETPPNLNREPFDAALFYGDEGHVLAKDALVPVVAPFMADQVQSNADLNKLPRIADRIWADDWDIWWRAQGEDPKPVRGPAHSLYALAVEDAMAGAGVLMGHTALIAPQLADGRLVRVAQADVPLEKPLALSTPHDLDGRGEVVALLASLFENP